MVTRLTAVLRTLRRLVSRAAITARLLGAHSGERTSPGTPGLVLLQIDGLGHEQMRRAIDDGRMPFIRRLLEREAYGLHHLYTGLPSTTPAVQGELLYGIRTAVPAFGYRDHDTREFTTLFSPVNARHVQQRLQRDGDPLLRGGSSYANVYTGGADRWAFCFAGTGLALRALRWTPLTLPLIALLHLGAAFRVGALLLVECCLALVDLGRGLIRPRELLKELAFVPARVAVCVLLRELVTAAVSVDVMAGRSVVHANLLGYDEQSHRRGPSSRFAHWTLRGIDSCIRRIAHAAARSPWRDYDVWVYSDHGQEAVEPHRSRYGRPVSAAVSQALQSADGAARAEDASVAGHRTRLLGRLFPLPHMRAPWSAHTGFGLTGRGPVNHLYLDAPELRERSREAIARALVDDGGVPAVLWCDPGAGVMACRRGQVLRLPRDIRHIVGEDRSNPEELAHDLIRMVRHADAGDLVLLGWCAGERPVSFAMEHGAHGGIGPRETDGFVLAPPDVLGVNSPTRLRPEQLRGAAQAFLASRPPPRRSPATPAHPRLRAVTYNIHGGIGMDGRRDIARHVRIIRRLHPDVVALQEVNDLRGRCRVGVFIADIADRLDMHHCHHACRVRERGNRGIALLSPHPLQMLHEGELPGARRMEPRGAILARITCDGRPIFVIATHLGLSSADRRRQVETLLGPEWLGRIPDGQPLLLCGDFNTVPGSRTYRTITNRLHDTAHEHDNAPSFLGLRRLDYIFHSDTVHTRGAFVADSALVRRASDHAPVVADLSID